MSKYEPLWRFLECDGSDKYQLSFDRIEEILGFPITAMEKVKEWIHHSDKTVIFVSHYPEFIACADKEITLA